MKSYKILYICSLVALIAAGILFVNANRQAKIVGVIESLKDKNIIFYSSNYDRSYVDYKNQGYRCMDVLCMEGVSYLKSGGLNSVYFKIEKADADPYTQSGMYLKKNLKGTEDYVLIDISRDQTRHGIKYDAGGKDCSPITIKIAKKSKCYDSSLLFAGRVKAAIEEKYKTVPVKIITSDEGQDYNQSLGSMGMLVEFGDSANTYGEAREALKIFCQAILQVDSTGR